MTVALGVRSVLAAPTTKQQAIYLAALQDGHLRTRNPTRLHGHGCALGCMCNLIASQDQTGSVLGWEHGGQHLGISK